MQRDKHKNVLENVVDLYEISNEMISSNFFLFSQIFVSHKTMMQSAAVSYALYSQYMTIYFVKYSTFVAKEFAVACMLVGPDRSLFEAADNHNFDRTLADCTFDSYIVIVDIAVCLDCNVALSTLLYKVKLISF